MKFSDLTLREPLQQAVRDLGFDECTPIQTRVLPLLLDDVDVAGQGQTGTGKTAAFLLAMINRMLEQPDDSSKPGRPRAVVIAPTRELVVQIDRDAEGLLRHTGLRKVLVFGGVDYEKQRDAFSDKVDLLVGTPGRMLDYQRQGVLHLDNVRTVALDEADRMFDMGFIRDIRYLLRRMPPPEKRLSMLFSATLPCKVIELAYEHMRQPETIRIEPDQLAVKAIRQCLYHVGKEEKPSLLIGLLQHIDPTRTIIFVNMKHTAEKVYACLAGNGYASAILTGNIPQKKRLRLLKEFADGELPLLVATDLAARGLHVPEVSHVINYDLPLRAEDYVHRIGRTARAGAEGDAVSLACDEFVYSLMEIEELLGQRVPVLPVTDDLKAKLKPSDWGDLNKLRPPTRPRPGGGRSGQGRSGQSRRR